MTGESIIPRVARRTARLNGKRQHLDKGKKMKRSQASKASLLKTEEKFFGEFDPGSG